MILSSHFFLAKLSIDSTIPRIFYPFTKSAVIFHRTFISDGIFMDYGQEAITSLIWILQTLAITSVVFSFGIFLLVRFTQWGKQFWMFAGGYLSPKRSIKPILFFLLIVAMTLLSVRISLVHSEWYKICTHHCKNLMNMYFGSKWACSASLPQVLFQQH